MSDHDDSTEEHIVIGRIAPGTALTRTMLAMMMAGHRRGEPPALWLDGHTILPNGTAVTLAIGTDNDQIKDEATT